MPDDFRLLDVMPETDLALVHALQISPRAPWIRIGSTIGVDAATAARRWDRLCREKIAWFTVRPSARSLTPTTDAAIVRLQVAPGTAVSCALAIAQHSDVIAVDLVSGSHHVVFVVAGHGIESVRSRITQLVSGEADVVASNYDFLAQVHREDAQWTLRVLSETQKRGLTTPPSPATRDVPAATVHALVTALRDDARLSYAALAERLDTSEATARRMLSQALAADGLHLGCDVAAQSVGLGRSVLIHANVDNTLESARVVARQPGVVRCAEVVGAANMMVMARFATLAHLAEFESELHQTIPGWRTLDRQTITRAVKRQGRLLDSSGRAVPLS